MAMKMVTCCICNKEVSKRSTLSLPGLGKQGERACRTHEEVCTLLDVAESRRQEERVKAKIVHAFQAPAAATQIRMFCTLQGVSLAAVYSRMRVEGCTEDFIREVKEEIRRMGGPTMSSQELGKMVVNETILQLQELKDTNRGW